MSRLTNMRLHCGAKKQGNSVMIRSATKLVFSICLGSIGLFVSAQIAVAQEETTKGGLSLQPNVAIAAPLDEATLLQKSSFIIGYNMTSQWLNDLKQQGVDCDTASLKEGIRKAVEGEDFGMTEEEANTVMLAFQKVVEKKQIENMKAAAELNSAEGAAYLAKNAQKEGVKLLENGVQYEVLVAGSGESPTVQDTVQIHYQGTLPDGSVFQSSYESGQPVERLVGEFVPGFAAALQAMKVGDKWKVAIPSELGFQLRGPGPIGPNRTLIFEIELLKVTK